MRKILTLSVLAVFLLACSMSELPLPGQVTSLPPTETLTPLPTATNTPDIPPTYTSTPTLIGAKPANTPTETPVPTDMIMFITPATATYIPLVPSITPTSILEGSGFLSFEQSTDLFYWGACEPHAVSLTVQAADPGHVFSVVMFLKYRNRDTGAETGWNQGLSMDSVGGGTYTIVLEGQDLGVYNDQPTWVMFQIVATDINTHEVARSPVFTDYLTLSKCP
jgi:hypothetical protein